jgi:hypothetical protein
VAFLPVANVGALIYARLARQQHDNNNGGAAMTDYSAQAMREEGNAAHERGAIDEASALFRKLLELYPRSNEAIDAVFYLTSGHRHSQRLSSGRGSEISSNAP